jgi:hypothetical protein
MDFGSQMNVEMFAGESCVFLVESYTSRNN